MARGAGRGHGLARGPLPGLRAERLSPGRRAARALCDRAARQVAPPGTRGDAVRGIGGAYRSDDHRLRPTPPYAGPRPRLRRGRRRHPTRPPTAGAGSVQRGGARGDPRAPLRNRRRPGPRGLAQHAHRQFGDGGWRSRWARRCPPRAHGGDVRRRLVVCRGLRPDVSRGAPGARARRCRALRVRAERDGRAAARIRHARRRARRGSRFWGRPGTVVGVVRDFHIEGLQASIQPLALSVGRVEPLGRTCSRSASARRRFRRRWPR